MKSINWNLQVLPKCRQRLGDDEEKGMRKSIMTYAKSHRPELSTLQVHKVPHEIKSKKLPYWHLYCFFYFHTEPIVNTMKKSKVKARISPLPVVDVAAAIPVQNTEKGKKWLEIVDWHFKVFGMPWRMRKYEDVHGMMISGGAKKTEQLFETVSNYVQSIKVKSAARNHFNDKLNYSEEYLNNYYTMMSNQELYEAIITLGNAVDVLHNLLFDMGEELGFLPPKKFPKGIT